MTYDHIPSKAKVCMLVLNDMVREARVTKEATSLAKSGFHIVVLAFSIEGKKSTHKTPEGFWIRRLFLRTRNLSKRPLFLLARYIEYIPKALGAAIEEKAGVYHAHDLPTLLPAYLASRFFGAKLLYDAHELWPDLPNMSVPTWWRLLERTLIHRSDRVITVSLPRAQILRDRYRLKRSPVVLHNCPFFRKISRTDILKKFIGNHGNFDLKIALYQGSISPDRGLEKLIDAGAYCQDDIVIIIMGFSQIPGYVDDLKSYTEKRGLAQKVMFHDPVPQSDILSYTASADVGVVIYQNTDLNSYYCAPNKLYEYLMAGLPVVACDFPGVRSIVSGQDLGVLMDPADPKSIGNKINLLCGNENIYTRIQQNVTQSAAERFSWEQEAKSLISLYNSLLVEPN